MQICQNATKEDVIKIQNRNRDGATMRQIGVPRECKLWQEVLHEHMRAAADIL